jgi:hypothetical protein
MEKLLQRLAQQLDSLDEASLMDLWNKYGTLTERFEPTKRWEEAALIFSMIQAKHLKNQLFNFHWSRQVRAEQDKNDRRPPQDGLLPFGFTEPPPMDEEDDEADMKAMREEAAQKSAKCRILKFVQLYPPTGKDAGGAGDKSGRPEAPAMADDDGDEGDDGERDT